MKKVIVLMAFVGLLSCQKSINETPQNNLVGTWQLVSYCKPISTMSCESIILPSDKKVFISFTNDKKFNEWYEDTKPFEYAFLGCGGGSYEIEGPDLRLRATCMSSLAGRRFPIVSVTAQQLILSPFETGDYVFKKR